jgi:hypothetical protein
MLNSASHLSAPVVAAWGMGVDSTAMIIEWVARGLPLSVVLTADTGTEREETYAFLPLFQQWMDAHGIEHHVLRYVPQRFKHWPPYFTLLENCLANATLPSISFGRHSCSQKWKIQPKDQWVARWRPARDCWSNGDKVVKLNRKTASVTTDLPHSRALTRARPSGGHVLILKMCKICANSLHQRRRP